MLAGNIFGKTAEPVDPRVLRDNSTARRLAELTSMIEMPFVVYKSPTVEVLICVEYLKHSDRSANFQFVSSTSIWPPGPNKLPVRPTHGGRWP